jgi:pimeloyl-ACP methyl ester carboxylesterase
VVYLHGLGGAGKWESYHMAFASDALVFVPQLPGWQESAPVPGLDSVDAYARLVVAFLDTAGIETADLVGHSFGGWLALKVAAEHPERVRRLLVCDSLGIQTEDAPAVDLGTLDEEAFGKALLARLGLIATAQPYGFGAQFTSVRSSPDFERQWRGRGLVGALVKGACLDSRLAAQLGSIRAQTLLVWGEADGLAPLRHAQFLEAALPNARLTVIQGAGHLPMLEKRETFHRICHDFLVGIDEPLAGAGR